MCCILVKGGSLISVGVNKESAPKRFVKKHRDNLALHAEIHAILGLSKESTKNCTAYIAGFTSKGSNMLTAPCPSCYDTLVSEMKIKRIVYTDRGGYLHEMG